VLVTLAVVIVIIVGLLGLSVDLGRVYIAKGELQNYADASAFAAVLQLNGLQSGVDAASSAAGSLPNKWDFSTRTITAANRTVQFGATATGTNGSWLVSPSSYEIPNITHVRVGVSTIVPLLFMPMVRGASSQTVSAVAVGGKVSSNTVGAGNLLPMAPLAPTPGNTTTFGFQVGQQYALRWSSNIGNNNAPPNGSTCAGDLALGWGAGSTIARQRVRDPDRGWWGDSSGSTLSGWIDTGYTSAVSVGDTIELYSGTKNGRKQAMEARVASDTDHTSTTYTQYENNISGGYRVGNGRRLIVVPVVAGTASASNGNGNGNGTGSGTPQSVLGFAGFFLHSMSYDDTNGNEPFCGTFIGSFTMGTNAHSGGGIGVTKVRLVR
jgi:hypothetical protein